MNWTRVYQDALAQGSSQVGYYHHNIRVDTAEGPVIVRVPIPGADVMDLRLWDEPDILAAIGSVVDTAPRLIQVSDRPAFQIHSFVPGAVLNQVAPRGVPVPEHVIPDVAALFANLAAIPAHQLPERPDDWPSDGDTAGFARRLAADSRRVYAANRAAHTDLYQRLDIPGDPFAPVDSRWATLTARPFVLVHSDVHRKNIIVHNGRSFFLDWELALFGDPVYDLAVHLHKMTYLPDEQEKLVAIWSREMPGPHTTHAAADLETYLVHEQIKSALVDSVRYAQAFAGAPAPYPLPTLAAKLAALLTTARRHWAVAKPIDAAEVEKVLVEYAN
jgi:hypothetical protein